MGLTMKERTAVTAVMRARYRRARKKQKGRLLDELVALTGYNPGMRSGCCTATARRRVGTTSGRRRVCVVRGATMRRC